MKAQVPILVVAAHLFLVACDNSSKQHSHNTDQRLATEDGVWPPVLTNTSEQAAYPAGLRNRARDSVVAAARESVLNNPQVRSELGSNYREYNTSPQDGKSDATASFMFFNYENNTTVEAVLQKNGSVTVNTFDASVFQPAENSVEVLDAIALGQTALEAAGHDLTNSTGTAMLAHPTDPSSVNEQYYGERILYVTFGRGNGELPDYSALVNLSTATVSDSGLLK